MSPFLLASAARADDVIDSVMYRTPELPMPRVVKTFPKGLTGLWLEALARPEADHKCKAALSIALAQQQGMTGLEATVSPLLRELDRPEQHSSVRLAVAKALVALDARAAAVPFLRHAGPEDPDLRELVEPALAHWNHGPVRAVWLARLGQSPSRGRGLLLAIRGLAEVREEKAIPGLRELLFSWAASAPVRLEAARALAVLRPTGSEKDAARLAVDAGPQGTVTRLAAALLLRQHTGEAAVRLLEGFVRDLEPAVAAAALARLVEIDTKLVVPLLEPVLASPDPKVRSFGVEVLFAQPSEGHIRLLGDRLGDPHPEVRIKARRSLRELASTPEWRGPVLREGTRGLAAGDWRGQEQAAVLLAQLGHQPAAGRLVALLKAGRPEVFIAAAWGLRQLAVPATLPAVLDHLQLRHRQLLVTGPIPGLNVAAEAVDPQLSQLAQLLGQSRYRPADAALRHLIPRNVPGPLQPPLAPGFPPNTPFTPVGPETRAAAIWALGLLHEGKPDPDLGRVLEARLDDKTSPSPDDERVRRMSAVSLGRMKAKASLPTLQKFTGYGKPSLDVVCNACRWAVAEITGEPLPPAGTVEITQQGWFLTPLE